MLEFHKKKKTDTQIGVVMVDMHVVHQMLHMEDNIAVGEANGFFLSSFQIYAATMSGY